PGRHAETHQRAGEVRMRKSYLCLAVALASLMLSLLLYVAAYSPVPDVCSPVTEAWYVYVDKQVAYGSGHVVKRSLANGDVEYRIETRVLTDRLGTRQEESTTA